MKKTGAPARDTQNLIIILCWFVYSSAYFGRYSFSSGINSIIGNYGVSKAETGLVMTFFFVAYGIGQVVNGFLCKRYSERYTFPVGLGGSAVINIVIFTLIKTGLIGEYFFTVKYIWLLNGIVQSLLWTSIINILGNNIEKKNIARASAVIGTTVPGGTFIAYSASSLMEHYGLYEYSFVLAAAVMAAVALCWLILFSPHERQDMTEAEIETNTGKKHKLSRAALIALAGLAVFAISNNYIKDGLQNWIPTILKETYKFSNAASLIIATSIYVLGISGSFIVKKINKSVKDHISLSILFFIAVAAFTGGIMAFLNASFVPVLIFFAAVMICGYAVNNIVTSLAPLALREELNPGVAAGLLDGFCYIGSALSTYTLGAVADRNGWNAVITLLLIITLAAVIIASLLKLIPKKAK